MNQQGFIAEIEDAPGDPAPKLIFADWLEERGDPIAQVIRDVEEPDDPKERAEALFTVHLTHPQRSLLLKVYLPETAWVSDLFSVNYADDGQRRRQGRDGVGNLKGAYLTLFTLTLDARIVMGGSSPRAEYYKGEWRGWGMREYGYPYMKNYINGEPLIVQDAVARNYFRESWKQSEPEVVLNIEAGYVKKKGRKHKIDFPRTI